MQSKNYSIQEVFNNTIIGLNFEFYTSKNTSFIIEDLSKASGKTVLITGNKNIIPTWTTAILLQEYNGKRPRYQLKISPQDFMSIGNPLHSILKWINENALLDYSTKLQVSLMFKNNQLKTLNTISNMDISKIVLKMDEQAIYNRFPEMQKSPFSLSIKKIIPYNFNNNLNLNNLNTSFRIPISENYGIDFTEQTMGILKFNYIGGSEYSKKGEEINETIKDYILSTYQVINSNSYTIQMSYELDKLTENYNKLRRAYFEPEFFLTEYKDIKLFVDLKGQYQTIKTYWTQIREPLLKLMIESNFKKGLFNYNLDNNKFELKNAKISGSKINDLQLIGCEVNGLIENSYLWKCKIKNSKIKNSYIVTGNKVESSLIESTMADSSNTIDKSYIINTGEIINCKVNESIIINAGIGAQAKLDENCTLIQLNEPPQISINKGIQTSEIRDYKWIKNMRTHEIEGFANEFKNKY